MIAINLLPPEYISTRAARRRATTWSAATALYGLLLAGTAVALGVITQRDGSDPAPQIGLISGEIIQAEREVEQTKVKSRALMTRLSAARAVGVHPDYSVLLGLLANLREGDIVLGSVSVASSTVTEPLPPGSPSKAKPKESPRIMLGLTGLAKSPAAVAAFALRLEKSGLFSNVSLADTAASPMNDHRAVEATAFRITARFSAEAPESPALPAPPAASPAKSKDKP